MALYDVPIDRRFTVLTHTSHPLFSQNGFKQVGNTTVPANPVSANRVMPSALYNKSLSAVKGISEAGYGMRFPNRGLSYGGAGSPRASISGLRYAGAGSPNASVYRPGLSYGGAGSPRSSVLRDAFINDNPPPGTIRVSGLRDTPVPVDTGTTEGPSIPTLPANTDSTGFFAPITTAFENIFGTAVATAGTVGQSAAANAVANAIAPPPSPVQQALTAVKSALPTSLLGISSSTLMILAIGGVAYYALKK